MKNRNSWKRKKVIITAGPTREALDPVRFLTNASSGKMGYALAAEARRRGAEVTLISGPTALHPPRHVLFVPVTSAREMLNAALQYGPKSDLFIGAAAVADWRPKRTSAKKINKTSFTSLKKTLHLQSNPDILKAVARKRRGNKPSLVGFALETDKLIENAKKKLNEKSLDMIVANKPAAINQDVTDAVFISQSGVEKHFNRISKKSLARSIFSFLSENAAPAFPR